MANPTLGSTSPTTLVAGAMPVTVTLTGTNFATGIVVSSATPGVTVTNSAYVSATSATCKMAVAAGNSRSRVSMTITNLDAGTVTDTTHGPTVVAPALSTGGGDAVAYAANTIPGTTPGTAGEAIKSAMATTHQVLNPAYDPANEGVGAAPGGVQGSSAGNPGLVSPRGAEDPTGDNPAASTGDTEGVPLTDHSAQLPLAPTSVTATAGVAGHATVSWTAPTNADEATEYDVTTYTIVGTSSNGGTTVTTTTTGTPAAVTKDVSGLTSAKAYTFVVTATTAAGAGTASAASNSVTIA